MNLNDLAKLIKDFLSHDEKSKIRTAKLLIGFKESVRDLNKQFSKIENYRRNLSDSDYIQLSTISKQLI